MHGPTYLPPVHALTPVPLTSNVIEGIPVAFIGLTLKGSAEIVAPAGRSNSTRQFSGLLEPLFDLMKDDAFRKAVASLPGYDIGPMGQVVEEF